MSHLYEFGAFRLYPGTRVLQRNKQHIPLGGRAFDILVALVRSQGKVLSHWQLMAAAWPGLVVEDANIRVQVASLRRSLSGEQGITRYIVSVPGRGYYFAAPVNQREYDEANVSPDEDARPLSHLPVPLGGALGRNTCIEELSHLIAEHRLVTIVGGGGTGKTTLAVLTGHALQGFDARFFVDLSAVQHDERVLGALASSLGCEASHAMQLSDVLELLSDQKTLIILDNCEHVIEAVAELSLRLVENCASVHLLLTSREALRVMGERVCLVKPLGFPPESSSVSVDDAINWPAVQLFMTRIAASGANAELSDQDMAKVACLCRRLDGNPLAIGLVASQVGVYGIEGVEDLIASQLALHWQGQRDAPPRHQSVDAAITWTYALLPERDRFVFSCLSVFVGAFSWEAAIEIIADDSVSGTQVVEALDALVNKCLVSVIDETDRAYLRLPETTRVFASIKLDRSLRRHAVFLRHACYYARMLRSAQSPQNSGRQARDVLESLDMGNVQAAIEWGFTNERTTSQAVEMVRLAVPFFLNKLLINECTRVCDRALRQLPDEYRSTDLELSLLESRALVYASVGQYDDSMICVLRRGIEISRALNDGPSTLHLLAGYHVALLDHGRFDASLEIAQQYAELANREGAAGQRAVLEWMQGTSCHFLGDLQAAERAFRKGMALHKLHAPIRPPFFEIKQRLIADIGRARVSWALGWMDQATALARKAIEEARDHPESFCGCATLCFPILLQNGKREECERLVQEMTGISSEYTMGTRYRLPEMLQARLWLHAGRCEDARAALLSCLYESPVVRISSASRIDGLRSLSEASMRCGDWAWAINCANEAIELALVTGERFCLADLLIAKAEGMLGMPEPAYGEISEIIAQASAIASQQKALMWQLRIAMFASKFERAQGTDKGAKECLRRVYACFTEGLETDELRAAAYLLVST